MAMRAMVVVVVAFATIGYVFHYPGFRRAFVEHWRPGAVARRMDEWAKRAKR